MARVQWRGHEFVVVAAALAAAACSDVGEYAARAKVTSTEQSLRAIGGAIDIYVLQKQVLPPDLETLATGPEPAIEAREGTSPTADAWGRPIRYERTGGRAYRVWSLGADGADATADDIVVERR